MASAAYRAPPSAAASSRGAHSAAGSVAGATPRAADGEQANEQAPLKGLNRLRANLLDSLRAERGKLERERALLGRTR